MIQRLGLSYFAQRTQIGQIALDVLTSEQIELPGEVTRYPTEDGSEMSDHIIIKSKTLAIEGRIMNSAFGLVDTILNGVTTSTTKLADVIAKLEALRNERRLFEVTTGLGQYRDMAFEALSFSRTDTEGGQVSVSAKMVQVRKVQLRQADVPRGTDAATRNRTGRTGTPAGQAGRNSGAAGQGGEQFGPPRPWTSTLAGGQGLFTPAP